MASRMDVFPAPVGPWMRKHVAEPSTREIEVLLARVGSERAHREAQRLHAGTSRSRPATAASTVTKTSCSSAVGGWPVISLKNPAKS